MNTFWKYWCVKISSVNSWFTKVHFSFLKSRVYCNAISKRLQPHSLLLNWTYEAICHFFYVSKSEAVATSSHSCCWILHFFFLFCHPLMSRHSTFSAPKKVAFLEIVMDLSNLQTSKKIFQITILTLKFKFPAQNSKQLIQISHSG